jgi:hypothetical protein
MTETTPAPTDRTTRARSRFSKVEMRRAFEAAREAGFLTAAVMVNQDGTLRVEATMVEVEQAPASEWEARLNGTD